MIKGFVGFYKAVLTFIGSHTHINGVLTRHADFRLTLIDPEGKRQYQVVLRLDQETQAFEILRQGSIIPEEMDADG